MGRKEYKVKLVGTDKRLAIIAKNEEDISYNLKGMAETEFMRDEEFSKAYTKDSCNFTFIYGKTGEGWEEDFRHMVTVYDRRMQKAVKTYFFEITPNEIDSITIEDYINRQQRIFDNKVAHGFNTTNVYQEARYILEEVAELMRAIEKNDKENMLEELADVVIFSYGCAAVAGIGDLDTKIFEKMSINESREYTQNSEGDFIKKN